MQEALACFLSIKSWQQVNLPQNSVFVSKFWFSLVFGCYFPFVNSRLQNTMAAFAPVLMCACAEIAEHL